MLLIPFISFVVNLLLLKNILKLFFIILVFVISIFFVINIFFILFSLFTNFIFYIFTDFIFFPFIENEEISVVSPIFREISPKTTNRERKNHILATIQRIIDKKEEFVKADELLMHKEYHFSFEKLRRRKKRLVRGDFMTLFLSISLYLFNKCLERKRD